MDQSGQIDLNTATPPVHAALTSSAKDLNRMLNQTVQGVTRDLEQEFQFNTVISKIRELVNELSRYETTADATDPVLSQTVKALLIMLWPITPHLAEELWEKLGAKTPLQQQSWPQVDETALVADSIEIVFQVNAKYEIKRWCPIKRIKRTLEQLALANEKVQKFMDGQPAKKIIIVPNKLVNIVV